MTDFFNNKQLNQRNITNWRGACSDPNNSENDGFARYDFAFNGRDAHISYIKIERNKKHHIGEKNDALRRRITERLTDIFGVLEDFRSPAARSHIAIASATNDVPAPHATFDGNTDSIKKQSLYVK